MSVETLLRCPACAQSVLADDEFCEACGAPIAAPRDAARRHLEVDQGLVAAVTDRGLVHRRNDDAFHLETVGAGLVVAVCDGVSVSTAPQVAAQIAADVAGRSAAEALRRLRSRPDQRWDSVQAVSEAVARAVAAVATIPWQADRDRDAPSCTIVLGVWDGVDVTVGWIGDSRAYWVDDDGCGQLTVDHSWAAEQVAAGRMSREAAEADGRAHAITRWLGADAPPGPCPTRTVRPRAAGHLVVCTDGLWSAVSATADLDRVLDAERLAGSPLATARRLVGHALSHGGPDNITVAVAAIEPASPADEERS